MHASNPLPPSFLLPFLLFSFPSSTFPNSFFAALSSSLLSLNQSKVFSWLCFDSNAHKKKKKKTSSYSFLGDERFTRFCVLHTASPFTSIGCPVYVSGLNRISCFFLGAKLHGTFKGAVWHDCRMILTSRNCGTIAFGVPLKNNGTQEHIARPAVIWDLTAILPVIPNHKKWTGPQGFCSNVEGLDLFMTSHFHILFCNSTLVYVFCSEEKAVCFPECLLNESVYYNRLVYFQCAI